MLRKYLDILKNTLAETTYKTRESDIRGFFNDELGLAIEDITVDDIQDVTPDMVNEWIYKMKKVGYKSSTIEKKLVSLGSLYKILARHDVGIVDYNPFSKDEGVRRPKTPNISSGKVIPDHVLKSMYQYFERESDTVDGLRDFIIFLLLVSTGLRRAEITNLKVGNIDSYDNYYIIRFTGKGGRERVQRISTQLMSLLDEYMYRKCLTYDEEEEFLFTSYQSNGKAINENHLNRMIDRAKEACGIEEDYSPHDFRHTSASKSYRREDNIYDIKERMGHVKIETTLRYIHTEVILDNNPADEFISDIATPIQGVQHLRVVQGG